MFKTTFRICEKCHKTFEVIDSPRFNNNNICLDCSGVLDKNTPTEVVIKPNLLDLSNIQQGEGSNEYRPSSFKEYIGQEEAKEKAIKFIEGSEKFGEPYPHTFIVGHAGTGKSLFATILANKLNKKIVFTTGGELKNEQVFIDKLSESDGGVIFIDEANKLSKKVGFFILPLIEQFQINGQNLKRFTCIFATTHIGDISKDLDALISRCDVINLNPYTPSELKQIITQYKNKQYPSITLSETIINDIVLNCRQAPRNAKNLVRAFAYIGDWEKVKKFNNIIFEGLTKQDVKVLKYLSVNNGIGKNSISNYLRIKPQTYEFEIEPYLIHKELITVGNRRKITKQGIELLNKLQ